MTEQKSQRGQKPVIVFGHQPNGFFMKRSVYGKIKTARALQKDIGGIIIFFYHDADADYRETITVLEDKKTKEEVRINFLEENKIQKKYSPLYAKKIHPSWKQETLRRLPRFVGQSLIDIFSNVNEKFVADFCLAMYQKMGLLDGIQVMRSSDKYFRNKAIDIEEYYADITYEGELVRAEMHNGKFRLHRGGGIYFEIPYPQELILKDQKTPGRDGRFLWMQSVLHGTHYIYGYGEGLYLKKEDFPDVTFVERENLDAPGLAYLPE